MSDTKSKHTPGPWSVYPQPISSKGDAILECIDQVQATESILDHIYLIDAGGKCAAIAGCGPTSAESARLIAAAPELLEALVAVMKLHCPYTGNPTAVQIVEHWEYEREQGNGSAQTMLDALAAIAKATGSES